MVVIVVSIVICKKTKEKRKRSVSYVKGERGDRLLTVMESGGGGSREDGKRGGEKYRLIIERH